MIGRTVAICTNGTRVLGLGNIGAVASMPVMEGKALFYRQMAGISAMPILIDTEDPDEFVETVMRIAPGFGAIHLEDIRVPDCFEIETRLIEALDDPGHARRRPRHRRRHARRGARRVRPGRASSSRTRPSARSASAPPASASPTLMVEAGAARVIASDPDEGSHARARERGIETARFEEVMAEARIVVATTGRPGPDHPGAWCARAR